MGRKKSDISEMDIVEKLNSPFPIALNALIKEHDNARELMEHLGISPQAVNQYRNGLSRPSLENICKIADFYNVSVDYLLGRTTTKNPDPNMQQTVEFTGLSEKSVNAIKKLSTYEKSERYYENLNWLLSRPAFLHSIISNMTILSGFLDIYQKIASGEDKYWEEAQENYINGEPIPARTETEKEISKLESEVSDDIDVCIFKLLKTFSRTIDDFVSELCPQSPDYHFNKRMGVFSDGND